MKISLQSNIFGQTSGPTHHMHNDSETSTLRKLGIDLLCREIETRSVIPHIILFEVIIILLFKKNKKKIIVGP